MINTLLMFDSRITQFINELSPHNKFFDILFSFFSLWGGSFFIWAGIIIIAIIVEEVMHPGIQKRDIKFIWFFLISFITAAILVNIIFKQLFYRPRPYLAKINNNQQTFSYKCPKDSSFPSGHAATSFAAATVLAHFDKKKRWFYYLIAGLISFSRIYLYCHYIFDVLIGAILGYSVSYISLYLRKITLFRK